MAKELEGTPARRVSTLAGLDEQPANPLTSRTVWAGIVGLVAIGASAAGYTILPEDVAGLVDNAGKIAAGVATVLAIVYRILATKALS